MHCTINIIKAVKKNNTKRIWFDGTLQAEPSENIVYSLTLKDGQAFEGTIIEKDSDQYGHYFVFQPCHTSLADFSTYRINKGPASLSIVFSPYELPGGNEIMNYLYDTWPDQWNCHIAATSQQDTLVLQLSKFPGAHDLGIEFTLDQVDNKTFSGDGCHDLTYFRKHLCHFFVIRREDNVWKIRIEHITDKAVSHYALLSCQSLKLAPFNAFFDGLDKKGIQYTRIDKSSDPSQLNTDKDTMRLKLKWASKFASKAKEGLQGIYYEEFMWHVFSYGRLPVHDGEKADAEFNRIDKSSLYLFFNHSDVSYRLDNAEKIKWEDLDYFTDIYICNTDFTWTYIITHEDDCGPYFHYKLS